MPDVELRVPADVQYVGLARLVVTAAARQAGMTNDRLEDLKIAVSEATASAMQAHQREGDDEPVVLRFGSVGADQFAVTIADAGHITDQETADIAARNWNTEGSLGVTLIRGLADAVDFDEGDAGMSVHMRFAVGLTSPRRVQES
jgi:serine/threonine-protein kinase RsbW